MSVNRTGSSSPSTPLTPTSPITPAAPKSIASGAGVPLSGTAASYASLNAVLDGGSVFKNISTATTPTTLSTIEAGSRGPQVTELKTLLRDAGYYTGAINDQMGAMGIEALKKAKLDLKLTGPLEVAGATTIEALKKAVAARQAAPAALSNERNHQFTLTELTPTINAYAQKYHVDPKLLAGIIKQESTYQNHIVHDDGTGHGLIGLDDNGLKGDFEKWSGLRVGSGADAISIPPAKQIEFLAKTISVLSTQYYGGDQMAAAREWHAGAGGVNKADGLEYEQLVRGHLAESDIANMGSGTVPTSSTPAATTPPSGRIVGRGDTGAEVEALQQQLVKAGATIAVDGDFGPETEAAVRAFQAQRGINADGTVGDQTRTALAGTATPSTKPFDVRAGSTGPQVTELKQALKDAGFYSGVVNDKMGADGLAALKKAKETLKLGGDPGVAGNTTLAALKQAASSRSGGTAVGNVNPRDPTLLKLANGSLQPGPTGYCVSATLDNMQRLGVAQPAATGEDHGNNPRGAMVQLMKDFGWKSLNVPGATTQTITGAYGSVQASVIPAAEYERLANAGKIPSGAVVFQTRHSTWNTTSENSHGFDMGIARDGGRTTFNYADMGGPMVYGADTQSVVVLVPGTAVK
jgi:peptidoglycan hydrolase-like protein with peptidoglycan-binding domain